MIEKRDATLPNPHDALSYAENIIATLREPFVVLDKRLRVRTANSAFYRGFHVLKEDTEGRFIYDLGDGQWNIPKLRTLLSEGLTDVHAVEDFEVEHTFPSIGLRNMLLNARRFPPECNDPDFILLAIEDNTDHKNAEESLKKSEQRQRSVLGLMPQKIFTATPNGELDYFNPLWTDFTGQSFEQIKEQGWTQFMHPDDLEETIRLWKHSVATGESYCHEHRFRRGDGVYCWHVTRAVPMLNEVGKVLLWVGSSSDVDAIKQAEEALRDTEVRYRRLFETAKDGILILDTVSGRITEANPFMIDLLGYSHEHFSGKELWEIGLFSDREANEAAVRELQEHGYIRYDHLPLETASGRRVEVEIVANSYQEGNHNVIQCNIRDITERSRLEKQMQEQAVALADLHRRKDEFLAMLGHELRNPLAPISNALHLLALQKNEGALQQKAHKIIERQVGQLVRLVDDLLEVSRITTGKLNLKKEQVTLNSIVERAVESARPLIDQHAHEFTVTQSPQPIWLYADATRLEQVVVNLLTNAAKYTQAGGQISLTVHQEDDDAVLTVHDTGVGISPELLPHIFDLFTQAERSLDRSQGGLGIGLCLVKRLVEMHDGQVEISSVLGKGSEFVVRLPVQVDLEQPPSSTDNGTFEPVGLSLRVLVVDDNRDAVQALEMLLTELGHDVRTAFDGPTALQTALDYRPGVVLLDLGLPGMDGYEVAKRIRQEATCQNAILVAVTGYGQESDRQRTRQTGFDYHLAKPPDFNKLQQILTTASEMTV